MEHLASRLRHRVTLQQPVMVSDTGGGYVKTWEDVEELWAGVEPLNGRDITNERFIDQHVQALVTHRVYMRYREGVTSAMRLLHAGRELYIHAVVNVEERGILLEILAEEGGA